MSVLEIILYSALGLGVAIYLTIGIVKLVKKKEKTKQRTMARLWKLKTCKKFAKITKEIANNVYYAGMIIG